MRLRIPPNVGGTIARPVIRLLARSWRITAVHQERWRSSHDAGRPYVLICWHEALLPLLWLHRGKGISIVVSQTRDGQYLADLATSIGYGLIRGSSSKGALRALLGAVKELQAGRPVALTPDGPRGPHREIKPGVIAAAQRGGAIVIPLHAETRQAWHLNTWDRFVVPKPFAAVRVCYGTPFTVQHGEAGFADGLMAARTGLDEAVRVAECPHDEGAEPTG